MDIFRILSSIMVVVTCMGIYQIINVRKKSNDLVRFFNNFYNFLWNVFLRINNLGGIIRWASGTLNYLYPVSAMLFVLIPFVMSMNERKIPILYKCISIMLYFVWKYGTVISGSDGFRNVDIYIHKIPKKEL